MASMTQRALPIMLSTAIAFGLVSNADAQTTPSEKNDQNKADVQDVQNVIPNLTPLQIAEMLNATQTEMLLKQLPPIVFKDQLTTLFPNTARDKGVNATQTKQDRWMPMDGYIGPVFNPETKQFEALYEGIKGENYTITQLQIAARIKELAPQKHLSEVNTQVFDQWMDIGRQMLDAHLEKYRKEQGAQKNTDNPKPISLEMNNE